MRFWIPLLFLWSNASFAQGEPVPPWLLPSNLLPSDENFTIAQGCETFSIYNRFDVDEYIRRTTTSERSWPSFCTFILRCTSLSKQPNSVFEDPSCSCADQKRVILAQQVCGAMQIAVDLYKGSWFSKGSPTACIDDFDTLVRQEGRLVEHMWEVSGFRAPACYSARPSFSDVYVGPSYLPCRPSLVSEYLQCREHWGGGWNN